MRLLNNSANPTRQSAGYMKRLLSCDRLLFLFFLTGCFLFFEINYRYWYRFMEQYSLFLFTSDYFGGLLCQPGGFNEYLAAFITQFFAIPFVAAGCLSILLGITAAFFYGFLKHCGIRTSVMVAILPVFLFWLFPVESITSILAVMLGSAAAYSYSSIPKPIVRHAYGFMILLILYLLATPAHLPAAVLMAIYEVHISKGMQRFLIAGGLIFWSVVLPLIAMHTIYIVSTREAFLSKYLFHPEFPVPSSFWYIWTSFPAVALVAYTLRNRKISFKKEWVKPVSLSLLLAIVMGWLIWHGQHPLEQAYRYYWYARQQQWDKIVGHAEKQGVKDKDALVYVNLAFNYTGRFNEGLMRYPQIGEEGFIPYDPKTRLGLIEASEVAWRVGHTNAAQRFAFVGVLSAERRVQPRLMTRLVETYLVNNEFKVAEKYIKILESTLFYRTWAKEQIGRASCRERV